MTADAPLREKSIRAFVALPLPDTLRRAVAETIRRLTPSLPGVRFVPRTRWARKEVRRE